MDEPRAYRFGLMQLAWPIAATSIYWLAFVFSMNRQPAVADLRWPDWIVLPAVVPPVFGGVLGWLRGGVKGLVAGFVAGVALAALPIVVFLTSSTYNEWHGH